MSNLLGVISKYLKIFWKGVIGITFEMLYLLAVFFIAALISFLIYTLYR